MQSLDRYAEEKLDGLERRSLRRTLAGTARDDVPWVTRGGRRLLSFSCNDYLGLSRHPAVKAAAIAAIERYGAGAGASRLVTGNHPPLEALEARLASMKGTQAACVFGSGYLANIGVLGVLAGAEDLVLIDELAHACLFSGARLSGARIRTFRHNDVDHARALLAAHRAGSRHAIIVTETVFSMDGDRAPIAALAALAPEHDAWLMTDDAHGFGLDGGDLVVPVPLCMGTLSKAIGGYGGYLCASEPVVALMRTRARSFVYSTGLPPASAAAALAALDVIEAEPALCVVPRRKARLFTRALGLKEAESAIVPLILGAPAAALAASAALEHEGFLVDRDPPADGAGRHRASALRVLGVASGRRDRAPRGGPSRGRSRAARAMPGLFVTATGTDVGKTYVTAGLIRAGRRACRAMDALKPVLSGYDPGTAAASDAGVLLAALGRAVTPASIAAIAPWRFAAPLSPDMAAAAEGRSIDFAALLGTCEASLAPDRLTLIEGVGGVMVPLDARHTTLDLAAALALPVILVSATALGAISHLLTARAVLHGRGLAIRAIVLDESAESTVPLAATRATLARFCDELLLVLPRDADDAAFDALFACLSG